jgi:ABC-type cobalamin/Fe3+-siderophores transport system ATPase subunit
MIEMAELTKRFDDVVAVDGISLEIAAGEFFGLLGPNGAGKSTTLLMLTTLLRPTSGAARVNGFDVVRQAGNVRPTGLGHHRWELHAARRYRASGCGDRQAASDTPASRISSHSSIDSRAGTRVGRNCQ